MKTTKLFLILLGFVIFVFVGSRFVAVLAAPNGLDLFTYLPIIVKEEPPTPIPTPTPTNTPLPTPTNTPTPTPTPTLTPMPSEVLILSSNAFVPYEGSSSLYVVGEVLNNIGSNVRFVQISGTLRDVNGNVVDSDYTYADISILAPNTKSPFLMIFSDPPVWATYELTVSWDTTSEQPYPLQILNSTSYFDSSDAFHVVGEITNQYPDERTFIEAYVTIYDSNGNVIGVGSSYTNPYDLISGQTASFDTYIYFWKGKPDQNQVASFSLQVIDD